MKPGRTFEDVTETLLELAAALDELDLNSIKAADREAMQAAWLASAEVFRAADDLQCRARRTLTDTILCSPKVARP